MGGVSSADDDDEDGTRLYDDARSVASGLTGVSGLSSFTLATQATGMTGMTGASAQVCSDESAQRERDGGNASANTNDIRFEFSIQLE
jgi:hypothetical protein